MPKAATAIKPAVKVDGYQPQPRPEKGFYHVYECPSPGCLEAIAGRNAHLAGATIQRAQRAIITEDKQPHPDVHCRNIVGTEPCNTKMEWIRTLAYPGFAEVARK